jgi:predicted glutamine amidotransferase
MNKDLPLYDITLEDFEQGMYKISLVDKPAIEENFIYFNKTEVVEMFANDEKQEVVGPIMIPNKEILRFSPENGYYYVRFTEETIRDIMYNYSKKGLFNEFGIHHEYDTDEVVMLEVWMKESDNDKSKDYGYDLPNGTVFVKAKIESNELFSAIKNGEVNGFSIEIQADIKPVNNLEMNEFAFAKELGKMEATFEATIAKFQAQIAALEEENANLLEAMTSFEEKFGGVEDLKSAIEMIQKHISSMDNLEEETEEEMNGHEDEEKEEEMTEETPEKSIAPAGEEAVVVAQEEEEKYEATEEVVSEEVTEEFTAEEEVTEESIEEQFAAEQKAEEVTEEVEDKTVTFNAITPEKVALINNFFNRK